MNLNTQLTRAVLDDYLLTWIDAFLIDHKARGTARTTIRFYSIQLGKFAAFCDTQAIKNISQITPGVLRDYLLHLEGQGNNPGGRHAAYRSIRAFLYWYDSEVEPEGWKNPIGKVKAPKVAVEPLEPVTFDTISQMMKVCGDNFMGCRDKAIFLCLLDTGARAAEFLAINLEDVNQARGDILIRSGKGHKPRTVFIGKQSRRALRRYLSRRHDDSPALWVTRDGERLTYDGLRAVFSRRAKAANVKEPSAHSFRRAFALSMLRGGTDVFTLAKLMGHEGIGVLQRYLKQETSDTEAAHRSHGPVDNLGRMK